MSESIFGVFQSVAAVGKLASVYLTTDGKLIEKKGAIRSITNFGVLLQNSEETTFVSSETMQNFTILDAGEGPTGTVQDATSSGDVHPADGEQELENSNEPVAVGDDNAVPLISDEHFSDFFEPIVLHPPRPDFAISGLAQDDQTDLVRWKNKYDYAIKVSEMERIVGDVKPIARLAERLRHPEVYLLAGSIAIEARIYDVAQSSLFSALNLGSSRAAAALSWLAWYHDKNPDCAFEMAC